MNASSRFRRIGVAVVAAMVVVSVRMDAHDIPNDVLVQALLKPEGQHLRMLVRLPLDSMRDVKFPLRDADYLDLARVEPSLREAATVWIGREVEMYEGDRRLPDPRITAIRVSLPSDHSFQAYETASALLTSPPLDPATDLVWNQAMLDVMFEYDIASDRSHFSIRPGLWPLGVVVTTALQFEMADGTVRVFELHNDPGLVRLDPSWLQAVLRFVRSGFDHILSGADHLLFLLCLVIPLRRLRSLVVVVTAFTVAHSMTLIASAYDLAPGALWFPPLVETLIAASIVYMALENIVGASIRRRWAVAFGFGLVHGFGFSFALRETLQFAGTHVLSSLLAFNVGVELGQLLVLACFVPALSLIFRFVVPERIGIVLASALVAHTGWHWMVDRGAQLARFPWPTLDAPTMASGIRWLMVVIALAGVGWLLSRLSHRQAKAGFINWVMSAFRRTEGGV